MNYVYLHKLKKSKIRLINDSIFSTYFNKHDKNTAITLTIPKDDLFITKQLLV